MVYFPAISHILYKKAVESGKGMKKRKLLVIGCQENEKEIDQMWMMDKYDVCCVDSHEMAMKMLQEEKQELQIMMTGKEYRKLIQDMNEEKKALYIEASTDSLTRLYNRRAFEKQMEELLLRGGEETGVLLMLDLDNFKKVNDSYGHRYGDRVLKCIAQKICEEIRTTDFAGRLGGDEFVIFLRGMSDRDEIWKKTRNLVKTIQMECRDVWLTGSVGFARYPQDGREYSVLLQKADTAMYEAKKKGKNCCMMHKEEAIAK